MKIKLKQSFEKIFSKPEPATTIQLQIPSLNQDQTLQKSMNEIKDQLTEMNNNIKLLINTLIQKNSNSNNI